MFRAIGIIFIVFLLYPSAGAFAMPLAQEPTPEITPQATAEPLTHKIEVIAGQDVRYDYAVSAGDVMIAGLLLMLVFSVWALGGIFIIGGRRE